jgi:hypothetical protein
MTSEAPKYQRLPGKKKGFLIGKHTLWLSSDHLLSRYSRFGVEDYKRFYFHDIQAIITRKSSMGAIQNIIIGIFLGVFSWLAASSEGGWFIFNGIVSGLMLIILLINWYRGPTCETHLLTAVQTEKLLSLNRLKTAQRVMNQLRSLIENAQGRINPEILPQQSIAIPTNKKPQESPTRAIAALKPLRHEKGRAHLILYALLLLDGLIIASSFVYTHMVLTLLSTTCSLLMGICVIVALVKQHESNLKRSLKAITWTTLGYVCVSFFAGYIASVVLTFKHPEIWQSQWELFRVISNTSPWESPLLMGVNIFALCGAAILGLPGLIMLKDPQEAIQRPSDVPATSLQGPASKRMS